MRWRENLGQMLRYVVYTSAILGGWVAIYLVIERVL